MEKVVLLVVFLALAHSACKEETPIPLWEWMRMYCEKDTNQQFAFCQKDSSDEWYIIQISDFYHLSAQIILFRRNGKFYRMDYLNSIKHPNWDEVCPDSLYLDSLFNPFTGKLDKLCCWDSLRTNIPIPIQIDTMQYFFDTYIWEQPEKSHKYWVIHPETWHLEAFSKGRYKHLERELKQDTIFYSSIQTVLDACGVEQFSFRTPLEQTVIDVKSVREAFEQ